MTSSSEMPVPNRRWFVVAFVAVTLLVSGISLWTNLSRMGEGASAVAKAPEGEQGKLEILTMTGKYPFKVDVMRTDADRAKGLMFRQSMPGEYGMLFDFERDQQVMMWMKNTYISLDMIFIRADGTVHRIERRTEPHSERTISSGIPVRAVLEVNAGISDKLGLKPGDRIFHPMFPAK
ncbi:MAG TPA: DUF192 domain-containing protein [Beijerinckiaceae bacterium]|nr:DUF192 domain-containing protein [Beijerinckiaceae bacterium]